MKHKKIFLIFFGPPASGKGTQSDMIGAKLKLPVISPGELLRLEQEKKTAIGKAVIARMAKGKLVDEKIITKILDQRMAKRDIAGGVIFDGYPRSMEQFKSFKKRIDKMASANDSVVAVYVNCSDQEVKKRITGRRVCDCGASYHLIYKPSQKNNICDLCGRKLVIREDDKPKVLRDRLKLFHASIEPLISSFAKYYKLIVVDGDKSIKLVQKDIESKLKKLI